MIAVVTILLAFPLGYVLRSHLAANTTYAVVYLWAFVYQTLYLTLDAIGGASDAGSDPAFTPEEFPLSYGLVALAIFGAGFGLVALGHAVRDRRIVQRKVRNAPVDAAEGQL
jgi:hypothetical protein